MLQSEFENHTGIYPDVLLYEAAEYEYNDGGWADKAQFCRSFEMNENGLAEKVKRIANNKWLEMYEKIEALKAENENLHTEITELSERADRSEHDMKIIKLKAHMLDALISAMQDEYDANAIIHAVLHDAYLLDELGVRRNGHAD